MTGCDTDNPAFFDEHTYLSPLVNTFAIQGCLDTTVEIFSISVIPDTTRSDLYILPSTNVSATT